MHHFTYLLINFFTIIICFVFSYHPKIKFYKYFIPFIISSFFVAVPFILWDIYFTETGVWWFNYDYVIGLKIGGLPIEEILFFFCIPFSCVYTYYCLTKFFDLTWANAFNNIIVFLTVIVCIVVALLYPDRIYTLVTAIVTTVTMLYLHFINQKEWIGQASLIYLVLMLGFFPVNGILTGTGLENPIVNYNPEEFLGIRMLTIPIEDAVYGYSMFMWNIFFFKFWKSKYETKEVVF